MTIYDFQYDGINLSDMGYMVCTFSDSERNRKIKSGSPLVINTISTQHGSKVEMINARYDECLSATFGICKSCDAESFDITQAEIFDLTGWLCRKNFKLLKLIDEDDEFNLFFEATFNINQLEFYDYTYGLELNMITNRPFALMEPQEILIDTKTADSVYTFYDYSNEEGFIYPDMMLIKPKSAGTLTIYNELENRTTTIENCVPGEIITMTYPTITTNNTSHDIHNDFNWNFFRVASIFSNKKNTLHISLPCTIMFKYYPVAKIGI